MKKVLIAFLALFFALNSFSQVRSYQAAYNSSSKGYYFLSSLKSGASAGAQNSLILDSKGDVVFYRQFNSKPFSYDFKLQPNGLISYFYNNKYFLLDSTFNIVDSVGCADGYTTDEHELQILPNGHYLL